MKIDFDSEAELENLLFDHYQKTGVMLVDGTSPDFLYKQMNLSPYGIADLIAISCDHRTNHLVVNIYELKKEKITASAISQACRYRAAFERTLGLYEGDVILDVYAHVVGTRIDDSCFLIEFSDVAFYEVQFDMEMGLMFTEEGEGWNIGGTESVESIKEAFRAAQRKSVELRGITEESAAAPETKLKAVE